jgi:hypothetical protein
MIADNGKLVAAFPLGFYYGSRHKNPGRSVGVKPLGSAVF